MLFVLRSNRPNVHLYDVISRVMNFINIRPFWLFLVALRHTVKFVFASFQKGNARPIQKIRGITTSLSIIDF